MIVCVGREKVNWPKGPREAGLGRDLGAPIPCNVERRRGLAPAVVLHCILGDLVGAALCGRPRAHSVCPPRHSEAPEGPWESVFPGRGMRIAASGLRPSSQ